MLAAWLSSGFRATNKVHLLVRACPIIRCSIWALCLYSAGIVVLAWASHRPRLLGVILASPLPPPGGDGIYDEGAEVWGHTPRPSTGAWEPGIVIWDDLTSRQSSAFPWNTVLSP